MNAFLCPELLVNSTIRVRRIFKTNAEILSVNQNLSVLYLK